MGIRHERFHENITIEETDGSITFTTTKISQARYSNIDEADRRINRERLCKVTELSANAATTGVLAAVGFNLLANGLSTGDLERTVIGVQALALGGVLIHFAKRSMDCISQYRQQSRKLEEFKNKTNNM